MEELDLIQRFFYQAKQTPNNLAIIDNNEKVSYEQLSNLTKRFAKLYTLYSKNPKVAITLPQGIYGYAAILGVVMAGGTYCPINTELPYLRKTKIINSFEPDVIVGHNIEDELTKTNFAYADIKSLPGSKLNNELPPSNCLYVMFTSGSTGEPKGIAIKRSAVSHFISWSISSTSISKSDKWGQFSNLGFDLSVMDLFTALGGGATLVAINSLENRLFPAKAIKKYGLTIWNSVPSVIDLINKAGQLTKDNISSIRLMNFSGEALFFNHVKMLLEVNPEIAIFNGFGPTETTIFCTNQILNQKNYLDVCKITAPLGKPIPGWELLLTGGKNDQEGEIIVWGDFIGFGYWKDEKATSKAYRETIVNGKKVRAYFTGDWAKSIDGNLYFRNRKDNQVKIKGYRVELSEIDFYIRQFGVPNSLSFVYAEKIYSCLETQKNYDTEKLSTYLRKHLPFYSIPSRFIQLPEFPRNSNDKIDRKKVLEKMQNML